ncbi:hypothetical protein [Bacillus safensis]|uniref:hypothetical protein n=1 Tax=Bacillus safensis TaxID=561879 RepID=UPI003C233B6C
MSELEFAIENGFKIKIKHLSDGSIQTSWADGKCIEIISHIEAEKLKLIKNNTEKIPLTIKEEKVLKSVVNNTYEFGLPVDVNSIRFDTNYSKRTVVGVISSLYKKGFVEEYEPNEFMLSESEFNKHNQ